MATIIRAVNGAGWSRQLANLKICQSYISRYTTYPMIKLNGFGSHPLANALNPPRPDKSNGLNLDPFNNVYLNIIFGISFSLPNPYSLVPYTTHRSPALYPLPHSPRSRTTRRHPKKKNCWILKKRSCTK